MKPAIVIPIYAGLVIAGYFVAPILPFTNGDGSTGDPIREQAVENGDSLGTLSAEGDVLRDPRDGSTFQEGLARLGGLADDAGSLNARRYFIEGKRFGTVLIEIDRVFRLATTHELLGYFAETDLAATKPEIISAAFARLAELAPGDAALIWSDYHQQTGKTAGAKRLAQEWAKTDPASAERWVDSIDDSLARQAALLGLLNGAMEPDPTLVERRLTDVDDLFGSIDLTQQLAWNLEPESFSSLADRLLSTKTGKWEYQNQLVSVLEIWGEREGGAMFSWLMEQDPGVFQSHVIQRVAQSRAESDPAAFARELGPSLSKNEALAEMAGQAWLRWLETGEDDDGAMQWYETHGSDMKLPDRTHWFPNSWKPEEAARVLSRLEGIGDSDLREEMSQIILASLSRSDPEAALDLAGDRLPENQKTDWFYSSALRELAQRKDPETAAAWALENLEKGEGQKRALSSIMAVWAESEPESAVEYSNSLPQGAREDALRNISYRWSRAAPEKFIEFIRSAPNPSAYAKFAKDGFWQFGHEKGGGNYLDKALSLPDDAMREAAVAGLFGGWSRANLESSAVALDKLEPGPVRDGAIVEYASNASRTDREAGLAWVQEISSLQKRRTETMKQCRYWLNSEKKKATQWIESSSLPDEWKAALLKQKE